MVYALEDIAKALKAARHAKGLSQRALSAKAGLTQAHISKIENAAVDLQLSNLIELARALDLELTLVPRHVVPAVESIVRSTNPAAKPADVYIVLRMLQDAARQLSTRLPGSEDIERIRSAARALQSVPLTPEQIKTLREAAREGQRIARSLRGEMKEALVSSEELKNITDLAQRVHRLRIEIASAISPTPPRPAYRLDDDEDSADG